jgi:hypothetical protein
MTDQKVLRRRGLGGDNHQLSQIKICKESPTFGASSQNQYPIFPVGDQVKTWELGFICRN